ncbi:MAG: 30S ribosomal protein S15 [Parcubacteria group bacterium]|nr:30S ribosomal protein S15 [Parcubacteria group bacterium]
MLTTKQKEKLIKSFQDHEKDTGSASVQVAVVTEEIERLALHLKKHPKDNHSRRGLLKMVAKRKNLLDYLSKNDEKKYNTLIRKLGLKK